MDIFKEIEEKQGLKFPKIYFDFYQSCEKKIPQKMIGSDLFNHEKELKEGAIELLRESNIDNFLSYNDFVFMMHQGYMFWYFKADGIENPEVYFYHETQNGPKHICSLKKFIKNFPSV